MAKLAQPKESRAAHALTSDGWESGAWRRLKWTRGKVRVWRSACGRWQIHEVRPGRGLGSAHCLVFERRVVRQQAFWNLIGQRKTLAAAQRQCTA